MGKGEDLEKYRRMKKGAGGLFCAFFFLASFSPSLAFSDTKTITSVAGDTYVTSTAPGSNFGTATSMKTGSQGSVGDTLNKAFLRFELSGLYGGTKINSATLKLYCNTDNGTSVWAYKVQNNWSENTLTNNLVDSSVGYGDPVGNRTTSGGAGRWWEFDVTAHLQERFDDGLPDYGFALIGETAAQNLYAAFNTKDAGVNTPVLSLTYTPPSLSYSQPSPDVVGAGRTATIQISITNNGQYTIRNVWLGLDIYAPSGAKVENTKTPVADSETGKIGLIDFGGIQGLNLLSGQMRTFSATYTFDTSVTGHKYGAGQYTFKYRAWAYGYPGQSAALPITDIQTKTFTVKATYDVYGRVTNQRTGEPVKNAEVSLYNGSYGGQAFTGQSDPDGYYRIALVPADSFTLQATRQGYGAYTAFNYNVSAATEKNIQLQPFVSITGLDVSPQSVSPGGTLTVTYHLKNESGFDLDVYLGASSRLDPSSAWYDDPDTNHDVKVTVPAGATDYIATRPFVVSPSYAPGNYDMRVGIWREAGVSGERYDYKDAQDKFSVVTALLPEFYDVDSIAFHDRQNAYSDSVNPKCLSTAAGYYVGKASRNFAPAGTLFVHFKVRNPNTATSVYDFKVRGDIKRRDSGAVVKSYGPYPFDDWSSNRVYQVHENSIAEHYLPIHLEGFSDGFSAGEYIMSLTLVAHSQSTGEVIDPADCIDVDPAKFFKVVTDKTPVILVHGIGGSPESFGQLEELLEGDLNLAVESFYYNTEEVPGEWGILECAGELSQFVSGYDKVDIISHSLGGLVTRAYRCGLADGISHKGKIRKFIIIGTPNVGADSVFWARELDNFWPGRDLEDTLFNQLNWASYVIWLVNLQDQIDFQNDLAIAGTFDTKSIQVGIGLGDDNDSIVTVASAIPLTINFSYYIKYGHSPFWGPNQKDGIAYINPPIGTDSSSTNPREHHSWPIIRDFLKDIDPTQPPEDANPNLVNGMIILGAVDGSEEPIPINVEASDYIGDFLQENESYIWYKPDLPVRDYLIKVIKKDGTSSRLINTNVVAGRTTFIVVDFAAKSFGIPPFLTADLDGSGQDDLIIDFGDPYGIWIYYNNSSWQKLHNISLDSMVTGNLDADPKDDIIIDFGNPYGIWVYYNNSTWTQLHNISPEFMETSDLDGNGQDDIVIDFGDPYGIWIYYNNSTWTQLHNISPDSMVTGNIDADPKDDIIIDFGNPYGIWVYYNNSTWTQLHNISPESMVTGNIDADPKDDIIIDFGDPYGIWIYYNNSTWAKLHNLSPEFMVSGDINNTGQEDLIVDFGEGYGIWIYYDNSSWVQLHNLSPEFMVTGDLDGDLKDDLIIDFGDPYGIWIYYNNSSWAKLHDLSP